MYLTQGGCVQRPLTSGPRGWPTDETPWSANATLQPLVGQLHGDTAPLCSLSRVGFMVTLSKRR
jgi:hypothetical protein